MTHLRLLIAALGRAHKLIHALSIPIFAFPPPWATTTAITTTAMMTMTTITITVIVTAILPGPMSITNVSHINFVPLITALFRSPTLALPSFLLRLWIPLSNSNYPISNYPPPGGYPPGGYPPGGYTPDYGGPPPPGGYPGRHPGGHGGPPPPDGYSGQRYPSAYPPPVGYPNQGSAPPSGSYPNGPPPSFGAYAKPSPPPGTGYGAEKNPGPSPEVSKSPSGFASRDPKARAPLLPPDPPVLCRIQPAKPRSSRNPDQSLKVPLDLDIRDPTETDPKDPAASLPRSFRAACLLANRIPNLEKLRLRLIWDKVRSMNANETSFEDKTNKLWRESCDWGIDKMVLAHTRDTTGDVSWGEAPIRN
ncbi:hypothetical protein L596_028484 [Steinernema carpocapsae]|uniref:Uncharacterized protein n=1 Tax=Steinernema carpocapsae TaxID=34508 RepID=A0A4U5LYL1_STECR|nr:hypothetical protein L596_028484 [Steinernema carpocapsae]